MVWNLSRSYSPLIPALEIHLVAWSYNKIIYFNSNITVFHHGNEYMTSQILCCRLKSNWHFLNLSFHNEISAVLRAVIKNHTNVTNSYFIFMHTISQSTISRERWSGIEEANLNLERDRFGSWFFLPNSNLVACLNTFYLFTYLFFPLIKQQN